jgi:hypothetical protein
MNLLEASLNHKNVDCICLCEHWLTVDQMNIIRLPGFNTISSFTRISHIHGRVLQMVKNNVDCRSLTWLANLSVEKDCELSGIYFPTLNLVVIMVYRSPSGDFSTFLLIVNNLFSYKITITTLLLVVILMFILITAMLIITRVS